MWGLTDTVILAIIFLPMATKTALDQTVNLREALPANHLARFVVDVVAALDLACIYERYGLRGCVVRMAPYAWD
jgi:hypothetical protein